MQSNRTAAEKHDLPPKVASRARASSPRDGAPVRHARWVPKLLGRAVPRFDAATLARRFGRGASSVGRRLTA